MLFGRVNVGVAVTVLSGGKTGPFVCYLQLVPLSAICNSFITTSAQLSFASVCWHIKGVRPDGVLVQSRHQPKDETTTGNLTPYFAFYFAVNQ